MGKRRGGHVKVRAVVVVPAVFSALIATAIGAVSASALASVQQSSAPCGVSFDPYNYTPAQVAACGYPVYPAQQTVTLAPILSGGSGSDSGSGSAVVYKMGNGVTAEQLVPPAGFRPETASAAELNEYGFPPRPSGGAALARWQEEMSKWRGSAPPAPFLTVAPAHTHTQSAQSDTPSPSGNWAGYVTESTSETFDHAEGWYYEPQRYSSVCTNPDESTWAGLGGWNSGDDVLAQNGTAIGVPGISDHQAWWEFYPYNSMVPINFSATQGALFDASVRYLGDSGGQEDEYRFWFYNYANNQTDAFNAYVSSVSGGVIYGAPSYTAEVIIERPTVNNQLTYLLNFSSLAVSQAEANGITFDNYPQFWTNGEIRHGVHMKNFSTGDMLADPSALGSDGSFIVTQDHCK